MNVRLIGSVSALVILGATGCSSERELPVESRSQITSADQKGTLSNPLKVQGNGKRAVRRVGLAGRPLK